MVSHEMVPKICQRLVRSIGMDDEIEVFLGDRAPLHHRFEVEHILPILTSVEDHGNLFRQFVGLHERENLEQLVERAESAREDHQRLREVRKPELDRKSTRLNSSHLGISY